MMWTIRHLSEWYSHILNSCLKILYIPKWSEHLQNLGKFKKEKEKKENKSYVIAIILKQHNNITYYNNILHLFYRCAGLGPTISQYIDLLW